MNQPSQSNSDLRHMLDIKYPIILAPMFLVSNIDMVVAACEAGITAAIPALNFRTPEELKQGIIELKKRCSGPFGINLIVNKSNYHYWDQFKICCDQKVNYLITSLGNPRDVIRIAHKNGIKVFCDVTDLEYAKKVEKMGADAVIAVNKEAGGHAGNISGIEFIKLLKESCNIPIISAGGVGTTQQVLEMLNAGAAGLSIGSLFIASEESPVSDEYKQACIDHGANDIVMTTKLSGTPCTVINTPYVRKVGTSQNFLERLLNKNKRLKKLFKAFTFYKGMKKLHAAAFSTTYKTVWCAGPSIEHVKDIRPIHEIVNDLTMNLEMTRPR